MSRTTYPTRKDIENRLAEAFPAPQTAVLVGVLDDIRQVEVQRAARTPASSCSSANQPPA